MKVLDKGHRYELAQRKAMWDVAQSTEPVIVQFVNMEPGREQDGTTTQEALRMLIDRTRHCNNCLPHPNNERVVYHLRMALVLHEARALERKVDKGEVEPEFVDLGGDEHFRLAISDDPKDSTASSGEITPDLVPYRPDWDKQCNHREPPPVEKKITGKK